MKHNFERIDFLIDQDLQTLAREYGEIFNTAKVDRKLIWAASRAYRKGLARGMQVAMEVDTLVQSAVDQDKPAAMAVEPATTRGVPLDRHTPSAPH